MGIGVKAGDAQAVAVTGVFALRGQDRRALAATLERVATVAPQLSDRELRDLASQLCRDTASAPRQAMRGDGEIRVGIVAWRQDQLAERARLAATMVGMVRNGTMIGTAGVRVSCGAGGQVALVFPGFAATPMSQAATLAGSLATLRWLDWLGVMASAAVGHGLGEIAGLVWAGAMSAPEAARLVAQYGEVLSGLGAQRTAMVRVTADEATAQALCGEGLSVAAYESPVSHVLAGPVPAVRDVTRLATRLGIAADVLDVGHALHTPLMAPGMAPLGSVLAQIRFGPVRRRLVSTVIARELAPRDDVAALLHAQLTSPVQFAEAVRVAAGPADLLFVAEAGGSLATSAAANCGLPTAEFVAGAGWPGGRNGTLWDACGAEGAGTVHDASAADAAATLFASGAMPSAEPLAAGPVTRPVDIWRDWEAATSRPAALPGPSRGRGRFLETVTALRSGSDLAAEARISVRADPYLADYLIDGRPTLPTAIGLEAMAQAASELARQPMRSARSVWFGAPPVVAEGDQVLLQVQARIRGDGVETILRAGSGCGQAEYGRAIFVGSGRSRRAARHYADDGGGRVARSQARGGAGQFGPDRAGRRAAGPGFGTVGDILTGPAPGNGTGTGAGNGDRSGAASRIGEEIRVVDGADLYGPVFFQTGRFRRVALVSGTPPRMCRAIVRGRDELPWFGRLPMPADMLVLGSPGLNDAAFQVVQACVPHRRLVPAGCDSVTVSGAEVPGAVELRVFLVSALPGPSADEDELMPGRAEYVWDVHGYDQGGEPVMAWIGLRMQDAGPLRLTPAHADVDTFPTLAWSLRDPVPSIG